VSWETEAENWIRWARKPGHDEYWFYSPQFFELVPPPGRATLEVGCGEGRVCRDLAACGHAVTGIDTAPTSLDAAREADPAGRYVLADAAALPFADAEFDLVVAYNALMDVDDMPGAVRETARVLAPGGRFCVGVTHPLRDAGGFASRDADAPFVLLDSYFGRRRFEGTVARAGLELTLHGWCYPLEAYARALEEAGFLIELFREPCDPGEDAQHRRIPLFLWLRALKPSASLSDTLGERTASAVP
jgi:SAM-dependent methyltransferase